MSFRGTALRWTERDGVLEVTLCRAPCNEIGTTSLAELEQLAALVADGAGGARALLFASDQRGFCAGADLRELQAGLASRRDRLHRVSGRLPAVVGRGLRRVARPVIRREVRAFLDRIHTVFDTLDAAPMVTVAAIHGACFGGGFELALTGDVRIADKSARVALPELRLGLVPGFGGIPRLRREVAGGVVNDLLLTGRSVGARRAHQVGLVSQLVGRGQHLEVARRVAQQAVHFEPDAIAAAKALAKPVPTEALREEKERFCTLVTRPAVQRALDRFVTSEDLRPYLP